MQVDGQAVPVIGQSPNGAVEPPLLSGHGFDGPDQIVLGPTTLAQLHKHVGETVGVSAGTTTATRLRVVGTATMPAVGIAGGLHPSMGTGALLSDQLIPAASKNAFNDPVTGPNAIFVRLRAGANPAASLRSLQQIAGQLSKTANFGAAVLPVQHPFEIINYRSMGTTPALLGAALALGATAALGLTLIASVRRRRRELALLKTLGFTRRQLGTAVAWQSSVIVAIGTLVGVPLGIALGRSLWDLFARDIQAVPQPTVPALSVALIAVGALVLATVVAAVPGRIAARTPTALMLRAE